MIKLAKKKRAAGPIDPGKLKGYVDRIEAVETRIVEERDARADIYTEVKAAGMKPKMVRRIIKERAKKDEDAAELAELEQYRAALAMPGATYRSVAAKTGVPRSTLHRLVPRKSNGTEPPHDPVTGEVRDDAAPQNSAPRPVPDGGVGAGTLEARQGEESCGSALAEPTASVGCAPLSAASEAGWSGAIAPACPSTLPQPSVCSTEPEGMKCDGVLSGRGDGSDEQEAPAAHEGSPQWQADCLKWRGKVLTGKHGHWCPEWDDLPIDETSLEWPCGCAVAGTCGGVESRHAEAGNMPGSVPGEETSASPSRLVGATEVGSISKSRAGVAPGPQDLIEETTPERGAAGSTPAVREAGPNGDTDAPRAGDAWDAAMASKAKLDELKAAKGLRA